MKETGLLFTAPMVRAILDGRKTRRKMYPARGVAPDSPAHLAARLLNGISSIDEGGCWVWGRTTSAGYGSMTVGGRTVRSHRLALALSLGRDEASLDEVCHRCDRPLCVNPSHLFEGTHGDNVRDAVRKGRARPPRGPRYSGEENPTAKLTAQKVVCIRRDLEDGLTQAAVAAMYGVSQSTISLIARGKAWTNA